MAFYPEKGKPAQLTNEFSTPPRNDSALSVENIKGIKVGETLITPAALHHDAENRTNRRILLGESDLDIVRELSTTAMPFRIIGEQHTGPDGTREPVIVEAEVYRFPTTLTSIVTTTFEDFSIRLKPEAGRSIDRVELNDKNRHTIIGQVATPDKLALDVVAEKYAHVEVRYADQEDMQPIRSFKLHKRYRTIK